ncbi:MAG: SPOR domain-containing protein [Bacteroidota bacterium]
MNKFWLGLIAIFAFQVSLLANDYYAVQVGVFLNPRLSDFGNINALGFLYAEEDEGNTYRVFVGDYDNPQDAERIEQQLKQRGYLDAFVARRNTQFGTSAAVIQVATRAPKDQINWERFFEVGEVFVLAENNQVKIVTGIYQNLNQAKADLQRVRTSGFSDAFPKTVSSARLHELGIFELGNYKKALIPGLEFGGSTSIASERRDPDFQGKGENVNPGADRPTSFGDDSNTGRLNTNTNLPSRTVANLAVPKIRTNVKRQSVLDLQKVLKQMGTYRSSLDGYYGDGTANGFQQAANTNETYQKYQILSKFSENSTNTASSNVQNAINQLPETPSNSLILLENSAIPIAKAYRAYWLFQTSGASSSVNNLMNTAIAEAYRQQARNSAPMLPIDPRSTYAYNDINQVVRHLTYIHQLQSDRLRLPCWMMSTHGDEVGTALSGAGYEFYVAEDCNGFYQWEITKVLKTISDDLSTDAPTQDGATLSRLYLAPRALSSIEVQGLTAWNDLLWQNLNAWQGRDPLHAKMVAALKLSYYQTQVQLEDHFMDKGFPPAQAKGLALACLKAMVGNNLERFV